MQESGELLEKTEEQPVADSAVEPQPISNQPDAPAPTENTTDTPETNNTLPQESQVDPHTDLVNKIMAMDQSLSADEAENRTALAGMDQEELQEIYDHEQQKVLIDKIIQLEEQADVTPEFIAQYKDRLKKLPNDTLQAMIDVQNDQLDSGAGLDRDSLGSPNLTESDPSAKEIKENFNAFELEESWLGKDGKGGLLRATLKSKYYQEFNTAVLQEEQETQAISKQVQAEFLEEYFQQENATQDVSSLEQFLVDNQAKIAETVKDRINAKIDEKVEEKFQEAFSENVNFDQFIEIMTNESIGEGVDTNGDDEPNNDNTKKEKSRRQKLKDTFVELVFGAGDYLADSFNSSDFGTFLALLLSRDAKDLHSSAFSNKKELENKTIVDDKKFKEIVKQNRKEDETTFNAYDTVFISLLTEYRKLTNSNLEDESLLKKLEDGDQKGLQAKAKKIYELFYEQISNKDNLDLVNKVFKNVFGDSGDLKGNFGQEHSINEKVLDLLYSFKDVTEYNKLISEQ